MSGFTYEEKDLKQKFEYIEWDNTWVENSNDTTKKRVLYVGDSISCGSRQTATKLSDGEILFDGFGTSKAVDNPFFKESLVAFSHQEGRRDVVLFNNGLHGWHLDDETEYPFYYEDLVKFMLNEFEGTPLYIVLTTSVANEEREKRVIKRNEKALEIAKKYNLEVIDLYKTSLENKNLICPDGVHYEEEGREIFAQTLVDILK